MLNNDDLLKVILADTAKKVLESLDSSTKAIQNELLTGNLTWKLSEDKVMDGLSKAVAKSVQGTLKSRYNDWIDAE